MSSLIIEKFKVDKVENHFNADRLDVITVTGWQVVTQRDKYKTGDEVIYIPINTILSQELEAKLFPIDSKIRLNKSRIRTIKLRKQISQGMILDPNEFDLEYVRANCTKWEPPVANLPGHMNVNLPKKKKPDVKSFVKYTDMENGKYYDRCLKEGEHEVVITTKLHGTSARYGWHKYEANVWYQKMFSFLKVAPRWVFCYGSRNVQLQSKLSKKTYYKDDVYGKMLKQHNLKSIPKGFSVYGEIVGDGIQKGWTYGCGKDEHKFYCYDVRDNVNEKWLDHADMMAFCEKHNIPTVPVRFIGYYAQGIIANYIDHNPLSDEVNEGVVLKMTTEQTGPMGRYIL